MSSPKVKFFSSPKAPVQKQPSSPVSDKSAGVASFPQSYTSRKKNAIYGLMALSKAERIR